MSAPSDYPWQEPAKPVTRGTFIVVEGLDRAGKTTQVKMLCDKLYSQGHNIRTIRFPDRTSPIGKMIDDYLQSKTGMEDHCIHLLFSANRWEKAKWIEETLKSGYTIVCDRYYYSGMVYSAAKQNPLLSLDWAKHPEVGLPKPDVVIFLDLEPEEAEKRGGYGQEKYEKKEFQKMVRKLFQELKSANGDEQSMVVINAGKSIEEVGVEVFKDASSSLESISTGKPGIEIGKVTAWN